jgi:hypothetical protein
MKKTLAVPPAASRPVVEIIFNDCPGSNDRWLQVLAGEGLETTTLNNFKGFIIRFYNCQNLSPIPNINVVLPTYNYKGPTFGPSQTCRHALHALTRTS